MNEPAPPWLPHWVRDQWSKYERAFEHPIRSFEFPQTGQVFDDRPFQLGIVNLSSDSAYQSSVVDNVQGVRDLAQELLLAGASIIDVGAESTVRGTAEVDSHTQATALVPAVEALVDDGVLVSIETYHRDVATAVLDAGAAVINLTGRIDDPDFYAELAAHDAGVIICYTPGANARSQFAGPPLDELFERQMDFFAERIELATSAGVERIWIDPGIGFDIILPEGETRIRMQNAIMLGGFRFRELGWPVCISLPTMTYLFGDEFRVAETGVAGVALMGKATLLRTHEVARVQPMIDLFTIGAHL
ncbi:MAG: dihydropteroate synthase [Actinomycetota bacterium]